jgi:hypothetical protein
MSLSQLIPFYLPDLLGFVLHIDMTIINYIHSTYTVFRSPTTSISSPEKEERSGSPDYGYPSHRYN